MKTSSTLIPGDIQRWLLDPSDPGPRYLALKLLSNSPPEILAPACKAAHKNGPIQVVIDAMHPEGFWEKDGPGYLPKYRSAAWSLILLSQLGASCSVDPRIELACLSYLERAIFPGGQISTNGTPSGTVDCLQGNILAAMSLLGFKDARLQKGYEWAARTVTGEGVAPASDRKAPLRYYAGKIGPGFQCGANNKLPCAWGASKVMLALSLIEESDRTPLINQAIQAGIDFIFSCDPATADYPNGWNPKPSGNWWKFGFPVFYVTDILQICQVMANLGLSRDPRLENALQLIMDKKSPEGHWPLEYGYQGKTWVDFGEKKKPNKWVTIRAYQALGSRLDSQMKMD